MFKATSRSIQPWFLMLLVLAITAGAMFYAGDLYGARRAGQLHADYLAAQSKKTEKVAAAQIQVVEKTEIKYRDRIKTIYLKGEQVERSAPLYVTAADSGSFRVNAGFVRLYDAGWLNETPGPTVDADREPSSIPLTAIAEIQAANASACLAWREQALGLREFYEQLRTVSQNEGR